MTPLMMSNVLSIGPLEGGVADDDAGLKAAVAPGNMDTKTDHFRLTVHVVDTRGRWSDT